MAGAGLPDDVREWIEDATGARLVGAARQAGGGRKQAWFVELDRDGEPEELFLRWDTSDPAALGDPWTVRREAAVYRALRGTPVPVAQFVSLHPTRHAMLATKISGRNWFSQIKDPAEQEAIAKEFMVHLTAVHSLDVASLALPDVDATAPIAHHVHHQLDEMDAIVEHRGGLADPVLRMALDWLRANVPAYDGRPVLVQGDTGPGNFMYEGGRVAAIVDWELAHLGDPMDDLAWVSLRAVQEPFTDLRARFREYAELSGHPVDVERIRYYRVLAEAKIMVMSHGVSHLGGAQATGGGGDVGARLVFGLLHRRLCAEALAEVIGVELPEADVPPADRPSADGPLFDEVLGQLRHVVVPRVTDSFAAQRLKGMARVLKYLAARAERGAGFDELELDELGDLIGTRPVTSAAGRLAVTSGLEAGSIDPRVALPVLYRAIQRENELLRESSGVLADRHYESPV